MKPPRPDEPSPPSRPEPPRARADLENLNEELEQRVIARTKELAAANEELKAEIAERKRVENALRTSECNFRALADKSLQGIAIFQNGAVYVNPAQCAIMGYSLQEFASMSAAELIGLVHPLDRAAAGDRARQRQAGEKFSASVEMRIVRKDGSTRWIQTFTNNIEYNGQPAVLSTNLDITERKAAEQALTLFRSLLDQSNDAIEVIEPDTGRFLDVNERACLAYGYSREEFLTLCVHQIDVTPGLRPWEKCIESLRQTGSILWPGDHRRKDGSVFPVEVNVTYVQLERDYVLAVARDITERKRGEARFRRLVDSNAQGVVFWKTDGEVTGSNDAFLGLVGYTREEMKAGSINLIAATPPEYADADRIALDEMAARGVCAPYEKEYLRKDGSRAPVLIGSAAFEDNATEGVSFTVDLTERKRLEQQALRSQRMENIGSLAGGIAHDLNNALGPIITSLDLLQMKFPDPDSQELLAIISASAQRGADMVRQVLSFARGVEGRRVAVPIKPLIRDVEKIANDTFLKHIQVRTMIPHDLWTVMGDPTQLHQVLLNLCVNARDAMPSGGTLSVSVENLALDAHSAGEIVEARPGPYVCLQVKDSGTGIPPEITEKIFDPFFTTKEVGKGTGLGLSTSLAIVKSHGGFIRVFSELGKGTRFQVWLPARTEPPPSAVVESAVERPRGNGELILVVDDEFSVRQITQQTLVAFGYRVVLASDGAEAVAVFARQGPQIAAVLTDMTMPVMDGRATIQVLRSMNPKVIIISSSGLPANAHGADALGLGGPHFLRKPYTAEELLKVLMQALASSK